MLSRQILALTSQLAEATDGALHYLLPRRFVLRLHLVEVLQVQLWHVVIRPQHSTLALVGVRMLTGQRCTRHRRKH